MRQNLSFSIWFTVIILAAFAVGYLAWTSPLRDDQSITANSPFPSFQKRGEGGEFQDWKTYRNEEYGFEVKYPEFYSTIEEGTPRFGEDTLFHIRLDKTLETEKSPLNIQISVTAKDLQSEVSSWEKLLTNRRNFQKFNFNSLHKSRFVVMQYDDTECGLLIPEDCEDFRIILAFTDRQPYLYRITFWYGISSVSDVYMKILSTFRFIE